MIQCNHSQPMYSTKYPLIYAKTINFDALTESKEKDLKSSCIIFNSRIAVFKKPVLDYLSSNIFLSVVLVICQAYLPVVGNFEKCLINLGIRKWLFALFSQEKKQNLEG